MSWGGSEKYIGLNSTFRLCAESVIEKAGLWCCMLPKYCWRRFAWWWPKARNRGGKMTRWCMGKLDIAPAWSHSGSWDYSVLPQTCTIIVFPPCMQSFESYLNEYLDKLSLLILLTFPPGHIGTAAHGETHHRHHSDQHNAPRYHLKRRKFCCFWKTWSTKLLPLT